MSSLIVRNLDERLVRRLKRQAALHGRSAEAEHRAILEASLVSTRRRSLAEVLSHMPNVGHDADFEREQEADVADVFD
jgi:plasmid stability protein